MKKHSLNKTAANIENLSFQEKLDYLTKLCSKKVVALGN
jgi:hypothetical protein